MNKEEIQKMFKENPIKTIKCGDIKIPVEYLEQTTVNADGKKYIQLQQENKKYKEVIEKVKELIIDNIEETTYEYIGSNKIKVLQKLIINNDGVNELLDILKEVE